ncbi:hypothetical protein EYF80_011403 [Liparis tanakae]|uniref:Uncharacterized protein n=1 Tax=Liparis tanakae TaxID=230148 RepID=A0A4Z2IKB5_9TELE|nr:hypothetical protein EYF80_011403 [Liparis tanakae]
MEQSSSLNSPTSSQFFKKRVAVACSHGARLVSTTFSKQNHRAIIIPAITGGPQLAESPGLTPVCVSRDGTGMAVMQGSSSERWSKEHNWNRAGTFSLTDRSAALDSAFNFHSQQIGRRTGTGER